MFLLSRTFVATSANVVSTWVVSRILSDPSSVAHGLVGYNPTLLGCALAGFSREPDWHLATFILAIIGGVFSAMLNVSLKVAMGRIPTWTLGFNLVCMGREMEARHANA